MGMLLKLFLFRILMQLHSAMEHYKKITFSFSQLQSYNHAVEESATGLQLHVENLLLSDKHLHDLAKKDVFMYDHILCKTKYLFSYKLYYTTDSFIRSVAYFIRALVV